MKPFISICIPAYKNQDFLKRLMDSIAVQTYRDFEVVITDDSPDDSVATLIHLYGEHFPITYQRHQPAKGTPANWNAAMRLAQGSWIKLMHDDDWFAEANSLQLFADATTYTKADFIFSGYDNVVLETGTHHRHIISPYHEARLQKDPHHLLLRNFIGHPSTTLIRNKVTEWYTESLKWVVDIEYYMKAIRHEGGFYAIHESLINIGIGSEQVTRHVFRKPEVEIPENMALINSITPQALRSIVAYDYFWRFIRNLNIRSMSKVEQYNTGYHVPAVIKLMITHQRRIPAGWLRIGMLSKTAMFISYIHSRLFNVLAKP